MRNVLTNPNVYMRTKRKILEACVRSRLTYVTQAILLNEKELKKLKACWYRLLRNMMKGGCVGEQSQEESDEENYSFVYTNKEVEKIVQTMPIRNYIFSQHLKFIAHTSRCPNTASKKKRLFAKPSRKYYRDDWLKIGELLGVTPEQAKRMTQARGELAELVHHRFSSTP